MSTRENRLDPRTVRLQQRIQEQFELPWEQAAKMLREQGHTWMQIAEAFGISYPTLYAWRIRTEADCPWLRLRGSPMARRERVGITREVVRVVETQRVNLMDACRIVARKHGMRAEQVKGVYRYTIESEEHRPARLHSFRPWSLRELDRLGNLMQAWRKRGRSVTEATELTAREMGRSVHSVAHFWRRGLREGRWTDPGRARRVVEQRGSLRHIVGGIGS